MPVSIITDKTRLLTALETVTRITLRVTTMPILSNVLIEVSGDRVTLAGTDLDMQATTEFALDHSASGEGAITVPAEILSGLAKGFRDGAQIALAWDDASQQVEVRSGRSRTLVNALPAIDFHRLDQMAATHRFSISGKTFAGMIDDVRFAVYTNIDRAHLQGVYLHTVDSDAGLMLAAAALDGIYLAFTRRSIEADLDSMPGITVPTKAADEIRRLALAATADLSVEIAPAMIRVTAGPTVFTSKLMDGGFVDYPRMVPANLTYRAVLDTAALTAAINRIILLATDKERTVRLEFDDGKLVLETRGQVGGDIREEIDCDCEGNFVIGYDARRLKAVLDAVGGDTVLVKMRDRQSPSLFAAREDANAKAILGSMRVWG